MKELFNKIWYDPVLSKVIAVVLCGILAIIWAFIKSIKANANFFNELLSILVINIQLYALFIAALLIFGVWFFIGKKNKSTAKEQYLRQLRETIIGNYNFGELYELLLQSGFYKADTASIQDQNLLSHFMVNIESFRNGVPVIQNEYLSELGREILPYHLITKASHQSGYQYILSNYGDLFLTIYNKRILAMAKKNIRI